MVVLLGVTQTDLISICLAWPLLSPVSNPSLFSPPSVSHTNLLAGYRRRSFHTNSSKHRGKGMFFTAPEHTPSLSVWGFPADGKTSLTSYKVLFEAYWLNSSVHVIGFEVQFCISCDTACAPVLVMNSIV